MASSSETPAKTTGRENLLFEGSEWTFDKLKRTHAAIEEIAWDDLGLDTYRNQIEVITAEQMLDAYCSIGMPLMYQHWSFGKRFIRDEILYRKGFQGLAYEIVINSDPCISYYMEENTMAMQTLVLAHAAFGHNHFFKNNYLFQEWTNAEAILDYLEFAKGYIASCEERHGLDAVEEILDACHALMDQGVFRYQRPSRLSAEKEKARIDARLAYDNETFNDIWRTLPQGPVSRDPSQVEAAKAERRKALKLPEENLLYFIEKNSPVLGTWEREILRIVRNMAQYYYPQKQTKMMNEGCACFVHYTIVNKLFDKGLISEGTLLEILHIHTNVVFQPDFDDPCFNGISPYAMGYEMMHDIRRICTDPTDEDREWFPAIAGSGAWRETLRDAWANFRDESFIKQFLSPHLIRKMRLFSIDDDAKKNYLLVSGIHNEQGYQRIRDSLARSYDVTNLEPDIQIVDVDLLGDRQLVLRHYQGDGIALSEGSRDEVLRHLRRLWGYNVRLQGVDAETGRRLYETSTET
jgi:spore cortex formation protein SpoVR/YcgB (stage V sporulation)